MIPIWVISSAGLMSPPPFSPTPTTLAEAPPAIHVELSAAVEAPPAIEADRSAPVGELAAALGAPPTILDTLASEPPHVLLATRQEWDYLREVAFESEFGSSSVLDRWSAENPPRIWIGGDPTSADVAAVERVVADLAEVTALDVRFVDNEAEANLRIHIVGAHDAFSDVFNGSSIITPAVIRGNLGLFQYSATRGDNGGRITRATVAVTRSWRGGDLSRTTIDHLIAEEITQVFGPRNDSPQYADSLFHQDFAYQPLTLSPLDTRVVELIYALPPGVTADEAASLITVEA